ncbi:MULTISPECIES: hypothetical protein [Acinetobacter calcoaceticus/baumannii complex]|uniref:Uncharacterized protein n=1 Tax=Acinetobacter nosocomialis TaxID=106654 RepID=A0AB37CVD1_ACINO|nr:MULTISPECIES: hypothetical protein [Acinetobacter calcoaceticus/baumannii complex]ELW84609.1 hypothetical protein ACIN5021_1726 [Acinetobacter sp. OIFC021]MBO8207750.1 hypothetical protein [Acinetobacter nosocomialis]MBO8224201.1 hypothetical protein [Acinetobacter nosocomialis]MBO8250490.1 hypothetical protein [Acinetobacter nosocomialis]MBP1483288.1 hypothetical protein [Acinetobacter nosocomialis]
MKKVTKKLSHLQNLTTVSIYKKYCQNIIFINYGQAVDES